MPEYLEKLQPDRDLQCYFERPSAIAAMHNASPSGFEASGAWRQQFDWCVIEWNRDNVIEHPRFRNLPDGDLRGLTLAYDEIRSNCITIDSDLYPTVDWPYLRVWADDGGVEQFHQVPIRDYATPIAGSYVPAQAEMELTGSVTAGDYVGLSFLGENHTYQLYGVDTLESTAQALVDSVNAFSTQVAATRSGAKVTLIYAGEGQTVELSTTGSNGNRLGVYGFVSGSGTISWNVWWAQFSGGTSPTAWRMSLPFDALIDVNGDPVPCHSVRKMRWTYAADLQNGEYERSEFQVVVTNWSVAGANRRLKVAGETSQRFENDSKTTSYEGAWTEAMGNYSGGTINYATAVGSAVNCAYRSTADHELFLGTRSAFNGATISISVDGGPASVENLYLSGEDVLRRVWLGSYGPGDHTVRVEHTGAEGNYFYFDFLEACVPAEELPVLPGSQKITLATDWDTDHSLAVPAERTAWMIHSLGFHARVNHYVGALWFYELEKAGHAYASATLDFVGTPVFSQITEVRIGRTGQPPETDSVITHVNRIGDTAETIAKAFELELNRGYTAIRAETAGSQLTIFSRAMGETGNAVTVSATWTCPLA